MEGVRKFQHPNAKHLWTSDGSGIECMRLTMTRGRFLLLLRVLKFDNFEDRSEQKSHDNVTVIRVVLDEFISKCKENYQVGEYSTVDKMLEPFREHAHTFYTSNIEVYYGRQLDGRYKTENSHINVVKRLSDHIVGTGKNITMDNNFTSISLAKEVLEKIPPSWELSGKTRKKSLHYSKLPKTSSKQQERFLLLLRALRFHNFEDRAERKAHNNLTAITDVLHEFVSKCKEDYQVGEYSAVDEMLEHSNIEVYCERQPDGLYKTENSLSCQIIITKECHHRENCPEKRERNPSIVSYPKPLSRSVFDFIKNETIVLYKVKSNKIGLVLSTLHYDDKIDEDAEDKAKP
ncbi:hypothetical protein ILUMI_02407 [Ignelater luminosus]|uniref:PiggyBac transposable element-derived protein domain-containing protein n=1 Tax=Ignelater luminosus TaxID=2038154 RepID=A0A8K0DIC2_IGNLU|nr:hypothetical protein ILUMI_02407 [Ignelater luminosus]